jgi:hypothetical protein
LAPFDVLRDIHASNAGFHRLLHFGNGEAVFRRFRPVDLHIYVKALRDPLGKNRPNLRQP